MRVRYASKALPVLMDCDIVVQDGSFAGISSALRQAAQGQRVVLVDPRTYLCREMTACLRPWLGLKDMAPAAQNSPALQAILIPACCKTIENEMIFNLDQVKIALEDSLLGAGVKLLYASRVIEVLEENGVLSGVVIGNKSCRQVIRCKTFLDYSSETMNLAPDGASGALWQTLEFSGVDLTGLHDLKLPAFLGVQPGTFRIHPGFWGNRHWLVEFPTALPALFHAENARCQDLNGEKIKMLTVQHLMQNCTAFSGAYWAGASHEAFAGQQVDFEANPRINQVIKKMPTGDVDREDGDCPLHVREVNFYTPRGYDAAAVPAREVPVTDYVDVLVVGGGTSGAGAAITAAENGATTMLVEMNPCLGGTATVGGVHSYWYGHQTGFTQRLQKTVAEVHRQLRQPIPLGKIPKWNIEVKAWALLQMAQERNVRVVFNSQAIGVVLEGEIVRGVVLSTPGGVRAVEARVIIDATGDGDLAVFSGAGFTYGSDRTGATMWYSLAQYSEPGKTMNNFTSMVDIDHIEDYTRAILSGRRRGEKCVEHGTYLAMRESRQVLGEARITLTDQLRQRTYADVINIAYSNHDVKGHTDSDWLRLGLIPPNLEVEIPFGTLIPQGLEHLLVVGKAISATHDALPAIRMQKDLENLGAAAGMLAAMAASLGCGLRDIPILEIQKRLVRAGQLPETVLTRSCQTEPVDVEALLRELNADSPLYAYSDMDLGEVFHGKIPFVELCCSGKNAIHLIREDWKRASGARRLLLAQALAMTGDASGFEDLVEAIKREIRAGQLPARSASIRNTQLPPDQAAMPDVVYWLYALGMLRDERAITVWEKIARLLLEITADDLYSQTRGTFYYVDAVCYGVERLGDIRCAPVLQLLRKIPYLRNQVCTEAVQADFVLERMAFLELGIARAMLCCGSQEGLPILIDYLKDMRQKMKMQAHMLLVTFTGMDLKADIDGWRVLYQSGALKLIPRPEVGLTDAQKSWRWD